MKAVNIKWISDGSDIVLPSEMEIPEEFIGDNGVDEDLVSDWLSDETGWLHDGFEITEED